jgi:predicted transcriptional regulator
MQDLNRMPTTHEIATKTELSRQTVHKHLKDYANDARHLEALEQFKFMTSKVLVKVFNYAVQGDVRAAKLYLETVENIGRNKVSLHNTQNNFIQINQLKVTQEELKQLKPEQLRKVEDLLKEVVTN